MRISESELKKLMALKGRLLTSKTTSNAPALTQGKQYRLAQISPMYGGNIITQPSPDPSKGPLSYIMAIIKKDDNGLETQIPIYNFIEPTEIISRKF